MKTNDVDYFEKVKAQLAQLHNEINALAKGKPDNLLNKFKVTFINETLAQANTILTEAFKPSREFTLFNVDDLPTNSDVTMILTQYLDCLEAWRCANIREHDSSWYWNLEDKHWIPTRQPTRFRKA